MRRDWRPPAAFPAGMLPWRGGFFILILLCLFLPPNAGAESTLYVQSIKAALYGEPRLGAAIVGEVGKGTALSALAKQGGWYSVVHQGRSAWISALLVAERPPAGTVSILQQENTDLSADARRRASAFTTAAAARGLQEERQRLRGSPQTSDFDRLVEMERLSLSQEEILSFLGEGVQP